MADSTEEELARIAEIPEGHLLSVPDLRGATCATGVKPSGGPDLALLTTETPWTAAGVFTRNTAAAAPIVLCREKLAASRTAKAVVINSGNANALTGVEGDRAAVRLIEPGQDVRQGRFAAAGGADQGDELVGRDVEAAVVERDHSALVGLAVDLAEMRDGDRAAVAGLGLVLGVGHGSGSFQRLAAPAG